jgi:hypothetical protein
MIKSMHSTADSVIPILDVYMKNGIDTIMGLFDQTPVIYEAIQRIQEQYGREMILVDTPIIDVSDNSNSRRSAGKVIRDSAARRAKFCLLHHSCVEQLVNKNTQTINRLEDYTRMIRDAGMIPGLSAHMPELIVYSDTNGYDVETYIQIYNCMGFLMQVEIEAVSAIIHNAKKPVMTIKPMAAGRCTPYVGLSFSWATLRDCDMVTVGCLRPDEACEDIEISNAALEHRYPDIGRRSSPNQNQTVLSGQ